MTLPEPFQLVAGNPVLDLVNTLDWRFRQSGPDELLNDYNDLLRFLDQSSLSTTRQLQQLKRTVTGAAALRSLQATKELREAVAEILYSMMDDRTPDAVAIKKLDHHIRNAKAHRHLRWNRNGLELSWAGNDADPQLPIWLLAEAASELLTTEAAKAIRSCADPECRWLFLDTSKNHSRRWCDMKTCGNRMKARRFKAQHRA
jgi:predicted RNA-binding Zn ribbon-like protein